MTHDIGIYTTTELETPLDIGKSLDMLLSESNLWNKFSLKTILKSHARFDELGG